MCRPTSTAPAPPTDLPRRSMDDWNTCAARPSGSATSPTTSHDRSSRPADSDPTYTLDPDEPVIHNLRRWPARQEADVPASQQEGAMMRLRPGYEVYWRGPGSTQIGVDPRCAVVLDRLTGAEQQLLEDLPQMMDVDWLHARGNELGMRPAQVRTLQRRLARAGVLVDLPG